MTVLDFVGNRPSIRPGLALVPLSDSLWRITRTTGEVLGYIEAFPEDGDRRFRAKRLLASLVATNPTAQHRAARSGWTVFGSEVIWWLWCHPGAALATFCQRPARRDKGDTVRRYRASHAVVE
jgi:hypothetical protein